MQQISTTKEKYTDGALLYMTTSGRQIATFVYSGEVNQNHDGVLVLHMQISHQSLCENFDFN